MRRLIALALIGLFALAGAADPAQARDGSIRLASTTSTENSGLFAYLLPIFEAESGIRVHVIAVGTGQALRIARNGDADVLLVHHRPSEVAFVEQGYGVRRHDVMYNDFVIVGPGADPAGITGTDDAAAALRRIAAARAIFVSRGDDSGTHKRERELWRSADVRVNASETGWYRETGSGMGATLNTAAAMGAYTLTDRATWISFRNKGPLRLLVEGDSRLFNQYGVILVNPERHRHINAADGRRFIEWLISRQGQRAIGAYRVNGVQLFHPNAAEKDS